MHKTDSSLQCEIKWQNFAWSRHFRVIWALIRPISMCPAKINHVPTTRAETNNRIISIFVHYPTIRISRVPYTITCVHEFQVVFRYCIYNGCLHSMGTTVIQFLPTLLPSKPFEIFICFTIPWFVLAVPTMVDPGLSEHRLSEMSFKCNNYIHYQ